MRTPVEMFIWALDHPWHCLGALFLYGAIGVAYSGLVLERSKTKNRVLTEVVPKIFLSLVAIPSVIFGLALIEVFTGEHKGQLIFVVFLVLISSCGFYFGFESARFSISNSKEDPFNPTDSIRVTLKDNKWPKLRTNVIGHGAFACFCFLFISLLYGIGLMIFWSTIQSLLPDLFLVSRTQLEFFFNELDYTLAFFFGSVGTGCFYYGRATVFRYAANMAIAHMNKIHVSENWNRTYANRQSAPVHPDNDWTYKHIFLEIAKKRKNDADDA